MSENLRKSRDAVFAEIQELIQQRDRINARIGQLSPILDYLSVMCEQPSDAVLEMLEDTGTQGDLGMTDAIRQVLKKASPGSLSPTQIRDKLVEMKFNLIKYANEMPPIHNTLKRLEKSGEIKVVELPYGRAYVWRTEIQRIFGLSPTPDEKRSEIAPIARPNAIRGLNLPKVEVQSTRDPKK